MDDLYHNSEGYTDPTAYHAIMKGTKKEAEIEKKAHTLIQILKQIICIAGFEATERIKLKDKKTGKEFK